MHTFDRRTDEQTNGQTDTFLMRLCIFGLYGAIQMLLLLFIIACRRWYSAQRGKNMQTDQEDIHLELLEGNNHA